MSKDNPIRYHTRVMNDYIQARYILKTNALDEAADVMFSANNLENHGYRLPSHINEVQEYLLKAAEIERTATKEYDDDGGEPKKRTVSRRAVNQMYREHSAGSQKGFGKRHPRKMKEVVSREDLDDENLTPETKRKHIERLYRWRGSSENRSNITPGGFQPHSKHHLEKLGLTHRAGAHPNLHVHNPLLFNLIQKTYHRDKGELDDKMIEAEKEMPSAMTSNNMLGKWSGDGVTHEKLRIASYKRYCENYKTHFPQKQPPDEEAFMHHKLYELRGIPSKQLFESELYDKDTGGVIRTPKTQEVLDTMLKANRHREMGILAPALGITMLDYEDQLTVIEWMMDGGGAQKNEEGDYLTGKAFDDSKLNGAFDGLLDARGFVSRNMKLFSQALHQVYSGNVGSSNTGTVEGKPSREASKGFKDPDYGKLSNDDGIWSRTMSPNAMSNKRKNFIENPKDSHATWKQQFGGFDAETYDDMVEEALSIEEAENIRSHTKEGALPDFQRAVKLDLITAEQAEEAQNHIVNTAEHKHAQAEQFGFFNNYNHQYKLVNHDFKPGKEEPEYESTPLDFMQKGLGDGMGALARPWDEIGQAFHETAPGVFFTEHESKKLFPSAIEESKGMKREQPHMQGFQYSKDMSNAERIEHKQSLLRTMNHQNLSSEERDNAEARLDNGERVELERFAIPRGSKDTQTKITQRNMKLSGETEEESQRQWESYLKANPSIYPASPGLGFMGCLLPTDLDFPMGSLLSAEPKSLLGDSYHPQSTHEALRLAAIRRKDDGRTFHSQGVVYSNLNMATEKKGVYDHSYNTNTTQDDKKRRLARNNLLYSKPYIGASAHTEEDLQEHEARMKDPKSVFTSKHKDVLGRRDGDMVGELTGDEGKGHANHLDDYGTSVYDYDDYHHAKREHEKGEILRINPLQKKSFKGIGELKQHINEIYHTPEGKPFNQLSDREQKRILAAAHKEEFHGHYFNYEDELKMFTSKPSAKEHYDAACKNIRDKIKEAHREGKEDIAELLTGKLHEQMSHAFKTTGKNSTPDAGERLQHEAEHFAQTHEATKLAMEVFHPLIEKLRPGSFNTKTARESNQTHANLAVAYNTAEKFMRDNTPEERRKILEHGKMHSISDGQVMSMKISEVVPKELIDRVVNFTVPRMTFKVGKEPLPNATSHFKELETKGQDVTGGHVLEAFINGDIGKQDPDMAKQYKIMQAVISRVRDSCKNKNDNEELIHRLYARYIPHDDVSGEPIKTYMRTIRSGNKTKQELHPKNDFIHNRGSHNHDRTHLADDGMAVKIRSGGEGVHPYEYGGKDNRIIAQKLEIKALDAVLSDVKSQTQGTSYAMDLSDEFNLLPNSKNASLKRLPKKLGWIFERLSQPTEAKGASKASPAEYQQQKVGGSHPSHAPLPANSDCLGSKDNVGTVINPNFTTRNLGNGHMALDDPTKNHHHQQNSQHYSKVDMNMLKDVTGGAGLPQYDHNVQYKGDERQPLQITEQTPDTMNPDYNASRIAADASIGESQDFIQTCFDRVTDDTLIFKDDGRPVPIKSMHRIFDLSDLKHLRGFSGDWIASHIYQGEPVILQKKGKKVKAYNADMKLVELTDEMQGEMSKVSEKDFVVHAIIDEEKIYFVDLLEAADEKTHNMPAKDRVRHLRAHFESSEHIKMPEPPNTKRADDEGLEVAVSLLRQESPCDILLRDASTTYMRGEIRHPKWVLLSKEKKVDVIILDRKGMNYRIGVGPIMHPEHYGARSVEFEEQHYMDVGSAKGPRGFDKGEYVAVFCTGVTCNKDEHPTYNIRSARIDRDSSPQATDSVESLAIMAGDSKVPHRARLKKGRVHIEFPSLHDEAIYQVKQEDGGWSLQIEKSMWGEDDYLFKLAEDVRPYWQPLVTVLLKRDKKEPEVKPEFPAGHSKKRKHILPEEEEIIKRGLEMAELMLGRVSKEKITSTGVEGLGINYAGADVESPRGPTTNMTDDTNLDFDPSERDYKEKPATARKKETRIRTTEGEEAITDNRGNVTITKPRV